MPGLLDCAGGTMDCLRREWNAVVVLSGAIAERECVAESRREKAAKLRATAAEELLRRYRAPAEEPSAAAAEADDENDDDDDDQESGTNT